MRAISCASTKRPGCRLNQALWNLVTGQDPMEPEFVPYSGKICDIVNVWIFSILQNVLYDALQREIRETTGWLDLRNLELFCIFTPGLFHDLKLLLSKQNDDNWPLTKHCFRFFGSSSADSEWQFRPTWFCANVVSRAAVERKYRVEWCIGPILPQIWSSSNFYFDVTKWEKGQDCWLSGTT